MKDTETAYPTKANRRTAADDRIDRIRNVPLGRNDADWSESPAATAAFVTATAGTVGFCKG